MRKFLLLFVLLLVPLAGFGEGIKTIQLFPDLNDAEFIAVESKINEFCAKRKDDSQAEIDKRSRCYDKHMKPVHKTIELYESASFKSKVVGQIHVMIGIKGPTKITYRYGTKTGEYPPDSDGTDSGYAGYFLYTVAAESGDWVQLPKRPFDKPVWINLQKAWGKKWAPRPEPIGSDIFESPMRSLRSIVITEIKGNKFTYRRENDADMNCTGEEIDRSRLDMTTFTKDISELYDSDGHLEIRHKYPRGC